jgi:hypothetical protein
MDDLVVLMEGVGAGLETGDFPRALGRLQGGEAVLRQLASDWGWLTHRVELGCRPVRLSVVRDDAASRPQDGRGRRAGVRSA